MTQKKFKEIRLKHLSIRLVINLLALSSLVAVYFLHEYEYIVLPEKLSNILNSLLFVIAVLFVISLILRLSFKRVYNIFDEPEERIFYSKIYSWSLYAIGMVLILNHLGVSVGNITIFLGLITTGFAFAVRDVLLSFFGWMILLRKKPFRIGDYIRIGEDEGLVRHIGTFYVLLDISGNFSEDYIKVPNRLFLEKSINRSGKNSLKDKIVIKLSNIPDNKDSVLNDLHSKISEITGNKGNVHINIDINNEKLLLVIEYYTVFELKTNNRGKVIDVVLSSLKNHITFTN